MRFKTLLLQNVVLLLGTVCIYKFFSLKQFFGLVESWKRFKLPIIDGEGISITFLGIPLDDDGVPWTDIMSYANTFLVFGLLLLLSSVGIVIWNYRRKLFTTKSM
ncbi:hypothetical protein [Bacillus suaedaesalsae]|uniref:DUF4306 domain-containing protein n=1 Tax=Bacillus suaedaesalsae TaxID=2810349 RepID=A0ABS2DM78_9BACI|nr:hypothetical protein [Bacillus suaedaesalsae]MBM6619594.1 hypothetical protein [Bacillus suaedaesalsae]